MPRVIHFEITSENHERASKFYEGLFGWKFNGWNGAPYWLIATGDGKQPGIDGGMMPRKDALAAGVIPSTGGPLGVIPTLDTPDLDDHLSRVPKMGGKVLTPRQAVPGVGYHAYCQDTEGNVFGLMQMDPNAR